MLGVTDLQKYMDENFIEGKILEMDLPTPTVEDAARVLGVLPPQIVKSILFKIKEIPVLTILNGTDKVDRRRLAKEFDVGRKKIKLANPIDVLDISGFSVGSMPPFGHKRPLQSFIDPSVLAFDFVFTGGGCGQALLKIKSSEILQASKAKILSIGMNSETEEI